MHNVFLYRSRCLLGWKMLLLPSTRPRPTTTTCCRDPEFALTANFGYCKRDRCFWSNVFDTTSLLQGWSLPDGFVAGGDKDEVVISYQGPKPVPNEKTSRTASLCLLIRRKLCESRRKPCKLSRGSITTNGRVVMPNTPLRQLTVIT